MILVVLEHSDFSEFFDTALKSSQLFSLRGYTLLNLFDHNLEPFGLHTVFFSQVIFFSSSAIFSFIPKPVMNRTHVFPGFGNITFYLLFPK